MKTSANQFLTIDCGTQSVRVLLFDLDGALIASSRVAIEPYFAAQNGWAEQDPEVYWDALCAACQALWSRPGVVRQQIAAVALTTQRGTVVNLDANGNVLRPAIVWLDQRRTQDPPPVPRLVEIAATAVGAGRILRELREQAECNWIAAHQPEIWQRTDKFLLLSGFLVWRLTGRFVDSTGAQVGYLPFDFEQQEWSKPGDLRWKLLAVRREQLPDLLAPGETLGEITAAVSEATGIPQGLRLIAAAADKACEVLGSGCIDPSVGHVSYGTTATFNTSNTKYVEPTRRMPAYPSAVPGQWNSERQLYRGYWLVSWFKNEFAHNEVRLAREQDVEPETLFDSLLEASQPGAMGLVVQPYWSSGARLPGPEARGAAIGFGDVHSRADLYRAIIEGICFALRESRDALEQRNKVPVQRLRVAGGGSNSDAVMQITADIFGLPAERPAVTEASGLGAAINAAVGTGHYP
ncbi:MAG: FGGY-family carbohydrate kinase, partial [Thermoleophilaceae bacterium]|nr:FGGY-family carbohydrate kinase [Thermoleophilaceae bacterium]